MNIFTSTYSDKKSLYKCKRNRKGTIVKKLKWNNLHLIYIEKTPRDFNI